MKTRAHSNEPAKSEPEFFSPDVASARHFFLDLNPSKVHPLTIVCGGLEYSTPGYAIHRDTLPFFSIEYVIRGHGELKLKGRNFRPQPESLFSYGPDIPHHIKSTANDPLVKYFVDFAGNDDLDLPPPRKLDCQSEVVSN